MAKKEKKGKAKTPLGRQESQEAPKHAITVKKEPTPTTSAAEEAQATIDPVALQEPANAFVDKHTGGAGPTTELPANAFVDEHPGGAVATTEQPANAGVDATTNDPPAKAEKAPSMDIDQETGKDKITAETTDGSTGSPGNPAADGSTGSPGTPATSDELLRSLMDKMQLSLAGGEPLTPCEASMLKFLLFEKEKKEMDGPSRTTSTLPCAPSASTSAPPAQSSSPTYGDVVVKGNDLANFLESGMATELASKEPLPAIVDDDTMMRYGYIGEKVQVECVVRSYQFRKWKNSDDSSVYIHNYPCSPYFVQHRKHHLLAAKMNGTPAEMRALMRYLEAGMRINYELVLREPKNYADLKPVMAGTVIGETQAMFKRKIKEILNRPTKRPLEDESASSAKRSRKSAINLTNA